MLLPRYCCSEQERFRLEGEKSSLWVTVTWVVFLVTGVSRYLQYLQYLQYLTYL